MLSIGHRACDRCDLAAACPAVMLGTPAVGSAATTPASVVLTCSRSPPTVPSAAAWLPVTLAAAAARSTEAMLSVGPSPPNSQAARSASSSRRPLPDGRIATDTAAAPCTLLRRRGGSAAGVLEPSEAGAATGAVGRSISARLKTAGAASDTGLAPGSADDCAETL